MTKLHAAVRVGDVDAVCALIRQGADVEAPDEDGYSPLLRCVSERPSLDCLRALIKSNADVDFACPDGYTALHVLAMGHWDEETEEYMGVLLEANAKTEVYLHGDSSGQVGQWTPLMLAVYESSAGPVQRLIEAGANVEAVDELGRTPLMLAAKQSNQTEEKTRFLCKAGADTKRKSFEGKTAYQYALEFVNVLVAGQRDPSVQLLLDQQKDEFLARLGQMGHSGGEIFFPNVNANIRKTIDNWPRVLQLLQ